MKNLKVKVDEVFKNYEMGLINEGTAEEELKKAFKSFSLGVRMRKSIAKAKKEKERKEKLYESVRKDREDKKEKYKCKLQHCEQYDGECEICFDHRCKHCGDEDVVLNGYCECCAEQDANGLFDKPQEKFQECLVGFDTCYACGWRGTEGNVSCCPRCNKSFTD